jgi:hypothetical protein
VIELLVIQVFSKLLSFSIIKENDIILCNAFDAYKKVPCWCILGLLDV